MKNLSTASDYKSAVKEQSISICTCTAFQNILKRQNYGIGIVRLF